MAPLRSGRAACAVLALAGLAFWPFAAQAHVKWFAPYIVGAPPQPMARTLADGWFWTGMALVLAFFLVTRLVERSRVGDTVMDGLDLATGPLWSRLDDYVRAVVGAFFVAIFAVGGIYLTPDLKTPADGSRGCSS